MKCCAVFLCLTALSFACGTASNSSAAFSNNLPTGLIRKALFPSSTIDRQSSVCDREACGDCKSCNMRALFAERKRCNEEQASAKESDTQKTDQTPPGDALQLCKLDACLPALRKVSCNIIPPDNGGRPLDMLKSMVWRKQREYENTRKRRQDVERKVAELQPYHTAYAAKKLIIDKKHVEALKARAYNVELTEYLDTFAYRRVTQEVTRLDYENEDLEKHLNYWKYQNETLSLAVTMSTGALEQARNRLESDTRRYEADAKLVSVLRSSRDTKESQVKLIKELKAKLRLQLEVAQTVNEQSTHEAVFIQKARNEIHKLLSGLLDDVRNKRVKLPCGGSVLGMAVGRALTG